MLKAAPVVRGWIERPGKVDPNVDRLSSARQVIRQVTEDGQSPLEAGGRLTICGACQCTLRGHPEVAGCLLPPCRADGVVGQPIGLFREPLGKAPLDRIQDSPVERSASLAEEARV